MTEDLVPDALTPASPAAVYEAMRTASVSVLGTELGRPSLLVLLAQWCLETGRGAACHNWNLGNVKHVTGDGRNYTMFRCNEVIAGNIFWFDPPNPATWFRAFGSLEEGAADYLGTLHARFAAAWPAVLAGDPTAFAHALKLAHYYTADEALYSRGLVALVQEFAGEIPLPEIPGPVLQEVADERSITGPIVEDDPTLVG